MRVVPAGVLLDVDDAVELEPRLRTLARMSSDVTVRRLADRLAELVADNRTSVVAEPVTSTTGPSTVATCADVAAGVGRSERTVRRWAASGRVPARKVAGAWQIGA